MTTRLQPALQMLAADRTRVGEIMTRGAITVPADLSVEQLIELFLDQGISRAPVVDDSGRPIGIVSKTDLVIAQFEFGDTEVSQDDTGDGLHVHEIGSIVRDIMTPVVFTLPESASIGEAARRMLADNVHAVPVVSDDHQLVGMLSSTDIVAWVAGAQVPQAPVAGHP